MQGDLHPFTARIKANLEKVNERIKGQLTGLKSKDAKDEVEHAWKKGAPFVLIEWSS